MTDATRKAREREKKRAAGLLPKEVWVHPDAWPAVRAFIEQANDSPAWAVKVLERME